MTSRLNLVLGKRGSWPVNSALACCWGHFPPRRHKRTSARAVEATEVIDLISLTPSPPTAGLPPPPTPSSCRTTRRMRKRGRLRKRRIRW